MKKSSFIICLLLCVRVMIAQDCYTAGRNRGIAIYNQGKNDQGKYKEALDCFTITLNNCPDVPANNDLQSWIKKCKDKLNSLPPCQLSKIPLKGALNESKLMKCIENVNNRDICKKDKEKIIAYIQSQLSGNVIIKDIYGDKYAPSSIVWMDLIKSVDQLEFDEENRITKLIFK